MREGGAEEEGERNSSRLCAELGVALTTPAITKSKPSQTPNQLHHPGAPRDIFFNSCCLLLPKIEAFMKFPSGNVFIL